MNHAGRAARCRSPVRSVILAAPALSRLGFWFRAEYRPLTMRFQLFALRRTSLFLAKKSSKGSLMRQGTKTSLPDHFLIILSKQLVNRFSRERLGNISRGIIPISLTNFWFKTNASLFRETPSLRRATPTQPLEETLNDFWIKGGGLEVSKGGDRGFVLDYTAL